MQFNSFLFLLFFAVVVVVYYAAPQRWRWIILLLASYYFYSTFQLEYLLLLAFDTLVTFGGGLLIARAEGRRRYGLLAVGVLIELAVLGLFKYFDFAASSLVAGYSALAHPAQAVTVPKLGLVLPVGLSFYTFSCVSYLVDVYRRKIPAEANLGRMALYVAFFPKLLAGPIERAGPFLMELLKPVRFDPAVVAMGLQLMLLGLFKKVVIADRLAGFVNTGFTDPSFQSPVTLLVSIYFYAFQIYCDFSAYSDLAIGAAAVLGLKLMENFRRPYLSRNIAEFWSTRWHISLSLFWRDYLYIPLGGSRVSKPRWYLNQLIVFLVSGLWHGANWTFVMWGGINGLAQVIYIMAANPRKALARILPAWLWGTLGVLLTFHVVLLAWVFFRADSIAQAWTVLTRTLGAVPRLPGLMAHYNWTGEFWLSIGLIVLLIAYEVIEETRGFWNWLGSRPIVLRWGVYYAMSAMLLVFGKWGLSQFVYMNF